MSIFRTYDIRGKYPEEINKDIVKNIAYYIAELFSCKKILLCRDVRNNSEELKKSLINGFKFFNKIFSTRKSNFIYVFIHFFGCHPDSSIFNADSFFLFIDANMNR